MERVRKLHSHLCSGLSEVPAHSQHIYDANGRIAFFDESSKTILTEEEREQYERDGYVVIRNLFTEEELAVWEDRFNKICAYEVEVPSTMTVMRDIALVRRNPDGPRNSQTVTKIQNFQDDPVMHSFCEHEKVIPYVRAFCGDNFRSIHSMLIHKPPDLGEGTSRHPMHQDMLYFPFVETERIVGSWVAMERVDRHNGCLSVIPGSHKGRLLSHGNPDWESGNNALYHGITDETCDFDRRVHLEMNTGDCVFFHPLLIHGSGRNTTNGFRKAISCHYASGRCTFTEIPKSLLHDAVAVFAKIGLTPDDFEESFLQRVYREHWREKSRQICGSQLAHWDLDEELPELSMRVIGELLERKQREKEQQDQQ